MPDHPVGNFGELTIQDNGNMFDFFTGFRILNGFRIVRIKCQAMLGPWRIGLGRHYLSFFKPEVHDPVELYKFPEFMGWYEIF